MKEYLEILLAPHMIWGGIILFFSIRFNNSFSSLFGAITNRIENVKGYKKTKNGHEVVFDDKQSLNVSKEYLKINDQKTTQEDSFQWPEDTLTDIQDVKKLLKEQRSLTYYWEYQFLNQFLRQHTQHVLDWFESLGSPVTQDYYHEFWQKHIKAKGERDNVLSALIGHNLILSVGGDKLEITAKGQEYKNWRGTLQPLIPVE